MLNVHEIFLSFRFWEEDTIVKQELEVHDFAYYFRKS